MNISEAGFFEIKENLKNFFKQQQEFTDHNFDGSALNILLDILAYNTHYSAVHANLVFSETFLDSAEQRGSVVSRAKELGYIPTSATASRARINLSFSTSPGTTEFIIPKNTKFVSSGETSLVFVTTEDTLFSSSLGTGEFSGELDVYQGRLVEYKYTVNTSDSSQRFIVPAKNVDTRFLSVTMQETDGDVNVISFKRFQEWLMEDLGPSTPVWFLKEAYDEWFEVYFGDGVIGRKPVDGNVFTFTYLITQGLEGNQLRAFNLSSTIPGISSVSVQTIENSLGGSDKESIDSIKFLAPLHYQAQNRAVTENDYRVLAKKVFPEIEDLAVWGGEVNDPPYYGKVYIAAKPTSSNFFSNQTKANIQNTLASQYGILGVRSEVVDPNYIDVSVDTVVTYNSDVYSPSSLSTDLENTVKTAIKNFFAKETSKFGKSLYYSQLVGSIDDSSPLILSSVTNLLLEKFVSIFQGISGNYTFEFNNAIYPSTVTSDEFIIAQGTYRLMDIPVEGTRSGRIAVYRRTSSGAISILNDSVGIVNYNTGKIEIRNLKIDSMVNEPELRRLTVKVSPGSVADLNTPVTPFRDGNVYTNKRDQIIRLKEPTGIKVTLLPGKP